MHIKKNSQLCDNIYFFLEVAIWIINENFTLILFLDLYSHILVKYFPYLPLSVADNHLVTHLFDSTNLDIREILIKIPLGKR